MLTPFVTIYIYRVSLLMVFSNRPARKLFIYSKYRDRIYAQTHPLQADQSALDAVSISGFVFVRILEFVTFM